MEVLFTDLQKNMMRRIMYLEDQIKVSIETSNINFKIMQKDFLVLQSEVSEIIETVKKIIDGLYPEE